MEDSAQARADGRAAPAVHQASCRDGQGAVDQNHGNDGYEEGPEDTSREQARQEASCETTAHDVLAFDVLAL